MYERMIGDTLHADRLRAALRTVPVREAERVRRAQRRGVKCRRCRETLATALTALATRIAPTIAAPPSPTRARVR
jgi:hypothetical protein